MPRSGKIIYNLAMHVVPSGPFLFGEFSDRFDQVQKVFSDPGFEFSRAYDRQSSAPVALEYFSAPYLEADAALTCQWEAMRALPGSLWFRAQDFLRRGESGILLSWSPPGRSLGEVHGTLPDEVYLKWMGEALRDLRSLHQQGLLHLAQNELSWMLFHGEEEGGEDSLGLATLSLFPQIALGGRVTASVLLATAPEMLRGETVDARTDLYSLACLLLWQRASHAWDPVQTMSQRLDLHASGRLLEFIPKTASPLNDLLRQMLQVNPSERPRDVVEVLRRLFPQESFSDLPQLPDWSKERARRRQITLILSTLYSLIREGEAAFALEWMEHLAPEFQTVQEPYLHYLRALAHRRLKNFEGAREFREKSIVALPERQDKKLQVLLLLEEARSLDPATQADQMLSLLDQAFKLAGEYPDLDLQAKVLVERAKLFKNIRKDEWSLAALQEAEQKIVSLPDCLVRGKVLRDLADLMAQNGFASAALPLAEEALRQVESEAGEKARRHVELGLIQVKCGNFAKATEHFREGKYLFSTLKDLDDLVWASAHEVRGYLEQGDFKQARRELKALRVRARGRKANQEILDLVELKLWMASSEAVEAQFHGWMERLEAYLSETKQEKIFREIAWSPADTLDLLSQLSRKLGRLEPAQALARQAEEFRSRMKDAFKSCGLLEKYPMPNIDTVLLASSSAVEIFPLENPAKGPVGEGSLRELEKKNLNLSEENQRLKSQMAELERELRHLKTRESKPRVQKEPAIRAPVLREIPTASPEPIREPMKEYPGFAGGDLAHAREEIERRSIEEALRRNRGNRNQTAQELKIHRRTLFEKMQKYGLDQLTFDPSREDVLQALSSSEGKKNLAAEKLGMSRSSFYRRLKELGIG